VSKKPRINLLQKNVCTIPECRCGWNIQIGSADYDLFDKFEKWLKENGTIVDISKKEEVWVAVLGSGGIVEAVRVSRTEQHAKDAITEHLKGSGYDAESWLKEIAETHEYPERFDPTNLYLTELE